MELLFLTWTRYSFGTLSSTLIKIVTFIFFCLNNIQTAIILFCDFAININNAVVIYKKLLSNTKLIAYLIVTFYISGMAFVNQFFICLVIYCKERCWIPKSKALTTLPTLPPENRIPANLNLFFKFLYKAYSSTPSPRRLSFCLNIIKQKNQIL